MFKKIVFLILISFLVSTVGYAAEETATQRSLDATWVMTATIIVFLMHAGFVALEIGFTRSKNALSILMKNVLTISILPILYLFFGFALMYGSSAFGLIGTDGFFLLGYDTDLSFFIFQAVFAATCASILSGAVAERIKLSSYLIAAIAMGIFIYPVIGHWTWGGGWLAELGFIDFAGSSVLHLAAAIGAAIMAMALGGRIGKYSKGKVNAIPAHNIPLGAIGVFILWWGWFGFNGGSALAADPDLVPLIITNTFMASCAGVIAAALYCMYRFKRIDATLTLNGALGGLVGITAGADSFTMFGSLFTGFIAGIILVESVQIIDQRLKIDDPVGAIAVHGVCGVWGTMAIAFFSTDVGLLHGGALAQVWIQLLGVIIITLWVTITMGGLVIAMKAFGSIRVPREVEIEGLDIAEHGGMAYNLHGDIMEPTGPVQMDIKGSFNLADRLNSLGKTVPGEQRQT
ncbi:ammonium transporter [Alkalihalobacillus sp. BA299]|uniref:ammonium transporter n=1 Tax=Alkalihalobacillus sp. BA299 TaxID=2815938 RepID=UPI001AD9CB4A|nr:ammonium transporter [Alkalihalobacillus sp. BA299]